MSPSSEIPTRIVLNFAHKCSLSCSWCYVPFQGAVPQGNTCLRIIERCARIGMREITLGGGDPFQYLFIAELAQAARRLGLFVHIDTNGIGLRETDTNLRLITNSVDLLALPLDGHDAITHDQMRSAHGHFELIMTKLSWLEPVRGKLKLNTVVAKPNAAHISNMWPLVKSLSPSRWSLYQFWPLSHGIRARNSHWISNNEFSAATELLLAEPPAGTKVELNPLLDRRLTYPFVSHDGTLYVHSAFSAFEYDTLGSIFEDEPVCEMFKRCRAERRQAQCRYR